MTSIDYDMERAAEMLAALMTCPRPLRLNTMAVVLRVVTEARDDPFPLLPEGHPLLGWRREQS